MKKKIFSLLFLASLFTACQDKWEEYYTENPNAGLEDGATENLMEILRNDANYSKFVSLLEITGMDKELERDQILTVWAPTDANYPEEVINAMSEEEKVILCENHINYIALYNTKLQDEKVVKTLAGKNLVLKEPVVDEFSIDGNAITKLNLVGTNGVIHELGEWLVPRKSIYEFIEELGDDHSIFRDSILSWSDTIFKPDLSFALGVDDLGNTIYDSVFVIENDLLQYKADVRNEDQDFTLFLSNNAIIKEMYDSMGEYYADLGMNYTAKDSAKFFGWMMRATIYEDIIENYTGDFESAHGREWRTEFQKVATQVENCSNGLIYNVNKFHVPKFLYLQPVMADISLIHGMSTEEQEKNITVTNAKSGGISWYTKDWRPILFIYSKDVSPNGLVLDINGFTKDLLGKVIPSAVIPGIYRVRASHRSWLSGNTSLHLNGDLVGTYDAGNSKYNWKNGGIEGGIVSEEFVIKEEDKDKQLRIRMEFISKSKGDLRIVPEFIRLEPTEDNY